MNVSKYLCRHQLLIYAEKIFSTIYINDLFTLEVNFFKPMALTEKVILHAVDTIDINGKIIYRYFDVDYRKREVSKKYRSSVSNPYVQYVCEYYDCRKKNNFTFCYHSFSQFLFLQSKKSRYGKTKFYVHK